MDHSEEIQNIYTSMYTVMHIFITVINKNSDKDIGTICCNKIIGPASLKDSKIVTIL